jgi:hypothetical protein
MSRSRRLQPLCGVTGAPSDKPGKRWANRRWRRAVRVRLGQGADVLPARRELGDVWSMGKDGKRYFNPRQHPRWLRK